MHKCIRVGIGALTLTCGLSGIVSAQDSYKAVPFPGEDQLGISDFFFPEDPELIEAWAKAHDVSSMAAHAWGIWTGLNMDSGEQYKGQNLRVFETWLTDTDLMGPISSAKKKSRSTSPHTLQRFRQFLNLAVQNQSAISISPDSDILGFVKFDPTAVSHILKEGLYKQSTLENLVKEGEITDIPPFPWTAISLKVVTAPLSPTAGTRGVTKDGNYYKVAVWPGPPARVPATPGIGPGYGPSTWRKFVWVDPTNSSPSGTGAGGTRRTQANTYNANQFINFTIEGVPTLVLAMHVTTREIKRWTWQTFWWTPTPERPKAPSSMAMAAARPAQLKGAARQYAVALAYAMTNPGQDPVGGKQIGKDGDKIGTFFGYNPHLEAGFTRLQGIYAYGVQSNCMSCHVSATYPGAASAYVGDEYISLDDPKFKGQVRLDFLYSLKAIAHAHRNE